MTIKRRGPCLLQTLCFRAFENEGISLLIVVSMERSALINKQMQSTCVSDQNKSFYSIVDWTYTEAEQIGY